jgi:hypothetical protein
MHVVNAKFWTLSYSQTGDDRGNWQLGKRKGHKCLLLIYYRILIK